MISPLVKTLKNHLAVLVLSLGGCITTLAFPAGNADTIFNAYNTAFYATNANGNCYYKNDTTGGQSYFWSQAEEIEMMLDVYDRAPSADTRNKIAKICNGFMDNNGSSWTWNTYNDDITWAVIAFSRAYLATGNTTFRNVAKANFDAMYARGWDTNFTGGGLWWTTGKTSKNACINGPAAVAACYLYRIYGDSSYLGKAAACYAWERRVLFHTDSGGISDSIGTDNNINTWVSSYNQGTFIGAANFLYQITGLPFYYQDAILAAKCLQNSVCSSDGIFPEYGSGDFGGFNGIGIRWATRMAKDQNLWFAYQPWLDANATAAWNVRNANNLSWEKWKTPTPGGTNVLVSWDCSDSVIVMQVTGTNAPDALQITGTGFTSAIQHGITPDSNSVSLLLTNTGTSTLSWTLGNTSVWLSVSANLGTLPSGGAGSVSVSLVPSATTNLPAGHYYANVSLTDLASGAVQSRRFVLVISAGNAPIAATGYNACVLAPNYATAAAPRATAFDIPNNYCFYQAGLNGSTRGLPPNAVFTSQADGATVFQLLSGQTNTLVLGNGYPDSATLTFATPQPYDSIAILACSANASDSVGTCVLNFTNGTHSQTFNFNAPDWFAAATNVAIQGFGRLKLGSSLSVENNGAANPNLYQTTLNLAALGINQPIASITFTRPANSKSQQTCGIFAVSGAVMPAAAGIGQQPQSVTNTLPAQGATFSVVGTGVSPLSYQWYYSAGGNQGTYTALASQTNATLTLNPELQPADSGFFYVTVTNLYGATTSSVVTLSVYRAPVVVQKPALTNLWRFAGADNEWSVTANAAQPVTYYWQQNGTTIPSLNSPICELDNLQVSNSGNYSVIVSNTYGAVTSSIATLNVVPAPTYPFGQMVLADGALGYWRLDETGGNIAHDYLAGNNGIYTPSVLLGQTGNNLIDTHKSARFGYLASSGSCVTNIPIDFATSGNAVFSIEAWVNGGSQTTDAGLVTKGYGSGGEQFNLDCGGGNHAFRFFVRDAGGSAHLATSTVVPNNQWHHLVGVCDEANGYIYLYVDGTNAAQTTITPYSGILSSAYGMSIGSRMAGAGTTYNNQFKGYIEEVAIYDYALNANQVRAHYQAATNRPPAFAVNPFTLADAKAGQAYSSTIATNAGDPNGDAITFVKISGPNWLNVLGNGSVNGTPLSANVGTNTFLVSVRDSANKFNTAIMYLNVLPAPPIAVTATVQGNNLELNWTGGISPYQIQVTTNLADPDWQNLNAPIGASNLVIPATNGAAFYRIYGQ